MSELTPKKIKNGIIGLTKVALGIDPTPAHIQTQRMIICCKCEHCITTEKLDGTIKRTCNECGCDCWKKTKILSETCPFGKWM